MVIAIYLALNLSGMARGAYCSLSAGGVTFMCPLGFLQRPELAGASSCAIIMGVAMVLVAILLLGRFFCGWICPMSIVLRLLGNRGAGSNGRLYVPALSISLALILFTSWIMGFPVFCIICPIGVVSRLIISALSGILDLWGIVWGGGFRPRGHDYADQGARVVQRLMPTRRASSASKPPQISENQGISQL